jgi:hypothetical protein
VATIVLVHGLWVTSRCWEHWVARYEQQGHRVLAPPYPGLEGSVESLRADPSPIAALTPAATLSAVSDVVRSLDRPIVIGRQPEFMPALPQARLIPVPDPTRSVSKNHACFSMYGTALVVEDLGSTNGVVVTRPDGRENDIGVGGRTELEAGSKVELGDAVITIGRA